MPLEHGPEALEGMNHDPGNSFRMIQWLPRLVGRRRCSEDDLLASAPQHRLRLPEFYDSKLNYRFQGSLSTMNGHRGELYAAV